MITVYSAQFITLLLRERTCRLFSYGCMFTLRDLDLHGQIGCKLTFGAVDLWLDKYSHGEYM